MPMRRSPWSRIVIGVPAALGFFAGGAVGQQLELVREIGGAGGSSRPDFFDVSDLALGPRGEILVLDEGAKSVLVFDSSGAFLRQFGREGHGPGEFVSPTRIRAEGDTVVVADWWQGRLTRFSVRGEVLGTSALPRPTDSQLSGAYPMADGSVVGITTFRGWPGPAGHDPFIRVLRLRGSHVDTLLSLEPGYVVWRATDGSGFGVVPRRLGRTGAVAVWGDSALALVSAPEGQLRVALVSEAGYRFLAPVHLPIGVRAVSDEALERLRERLRTDSPDLPEAIELIPPTGTSILTGNGFFDDAGAVWIETRPGGEGAERRWMVIARGPDRSRWVAVPGNLELMRVAGHHAYGIWTDSLDVQTVRVYRLR